MLIQKYKIHSIKALERLHAHFDSLFGRAGTDRNGNSQCFWVDPRGSTVEFHDANPTQVLVRSNDADAFSSTRALVGSFVDDVSHLHDS